MKTVGHLYGFRRSGCYYLCVGRTAIASDQLYLRMCCQPFPYLISIAGVKDGQRVSGVVVNNSAGINLTLLLGKVVYADISACPYLRIIHPYTADKTMARRSARLDVLAGKGPHCRRGGLVKGLMSDALVNLTCHPHIRGGHLQRFCKNLPLAFGIIATEMTRMQDESHTLVEKLQVL